MMSLSSLSEDTRRRQLFGNKSKHSRRPTALSPAITTFQSLDENTTSLADAPPISASTPVRCSLGEKDRPAGWQKLLKGRLQKGPLTPGISNRMSASDAYGSASTQLSNASNQTIAQKANATYKKKKNVKDELKRQSSLAAEAVAAASSPEYIANLTLQMKASEKQMKEAKEMNKRGSLTSFANASKVLVSQQFVDNIASPANQRSSLGTMHRPNNITTIQEESHGIELINRRSSAGYKLSLLQQKPHLQSEVYHEASPLCRLRNKSSAPRETPSLKCYQYFSQNDAPIPNQGVIASACQGNDENCGDVRNTIQESDENSDDAHNMKINISNQLMKSMPNADKGNKPILQSAVASIGGTDLTRSAKSNESKKSSTVHNSSCTKSAKTHNLLGFKNRDFGSKQHSLLSLTDPRIEIEKYMSRESQFSSENCVRVRNKCEEGSKTPHLTEQRRADRILNHRSNVGSTLKSVGIDVNKPKIYSKVIKMPLNTTTSKPPKKKNTLHTIISPKRITFTGAHRRKIYETVRTKRCLAVQARRGITLPQVRKVSYQRYSFLGRQRRQMLGLESGLIRCCGVETSSNNTVISMDSCSSSYCDEMLAQARELRKARLSLLAKSANNESFLGSTALTNQTASSGNSDEMVNLVVKRRKARLSSKLENDIVIGRTVSTETEGTSASIKRRKAMDKIRRNKIKAIQREADC